jgi:hypothetical protein
VHFPVNKACKHDHNAKSTIKKYARCLIIPFRPILAGTLSLPACHGGKNTPHQLDMNP